MVALRFITARMLLDIRQTVPKGFRIASKWVDTTSCGCWKLPALYTYRAFCETRR